MEDLLNRFKSTMEQILTELFETGMSEGSVEVNTLKEQVYFNGSGCLGSRRKSICLAHSQAVQRCQQIAQGFEERSMYIYTLVIKTDLREDKKSQTFLVFALELLNEVIDKTVVEIFSTKMGITSSGLYFENTLLNIVRRDTSKVPSPRLKMRTLHLPWQQPSC